MNKVRRKGVIPSCVGVVFGLFLIMQGCAGLTGEKEDSMSSDRGFAPPIYYDFGDVRLPEELKVNNKDSFVYRTAGISAGVLVLEGRVELDSLVKFFENNMKKDSWKLLSLFRSPRTIMLFQKEKRWCIINVTDKMSTTLVEIWVAPTISESGSGFLK